MEHIELGVKTAIAVTGGFLARWMGGMDHLLSALVALMVIDYATGLIGAYIGGNLSSRQGFAGIAKKVLLLSVVAVSFIIEGATKGAFPLREVTIVFFVANESLSILENAASMGVPLPAALVEKLQQLKSTATKKEDEHEQDS